MKIRQITPIRQISRVYGALINISKNLDKINNSVVQASTQSIHANSAIGIYRRMDLDLLLDHSSDVDRCLIDNSEWERTQIDYLFTLARQACRERQGVFVDVGAYFGLYALTAMNSRLFDRIFAIEADIHNFAHLQANLFLNNATHSITALNTAISENASEFRFADSRRHPEGNRGGVGILTTPSDMSSYAVHALPLDEVLPLTNSTVALKIDVEGHEAAVLRGMKRLTSENQIIAQIETFEKNYENTYLETEKLGLRKIRTIYPDHYFTNIDWLATENDS